MPFFKICVDVTFNIDNKCASIYLHRSELLFHILSENNFWYRYVLTYTIHTWPTNDFWELIAGKYIWNLDTSILPFFLELNHFEILSVPFIYLYPLCQKYKIIFLRCVVPVVCRINQTRVNHTVIGHLREIFSFLHRRRQGSCWKVIWNIFLECLFIP